MLRRGSYARYEGTEYKVTKDMDGNTKVLTRDKSKIDDTFKDAYNSGVYTKVVSLEELKSYIHVRNFGILKGERVEILNERNNKYLVFTDGLIIGSNLNLPRTDRDRWEQWLPKVEVELIEEITPLDNSE